MPRKFGVVVGMADFGRSLARVVNAQSSTWRLAAFDDYNRLGTIRALAAARSADAIISFGGPAPNAALVGIALRRRIPVIVIWAGSDVQNAFERPTALQSFCGPGFFHVSVSTWLAKELRTLGVDAPPLAVSAVYSELPAPLPERFRVLTYLPEPRRAFYGSEIVYQAARALSDTEFYVVGKGRRDPAAPPNVRFFGKVRDAQRYIDRCSVLMRMPAHDGLSNFVLEALSRGRHVIWNHDFEHVLRADSAADAIRHLQQLRDRHNSGTPALNLAGREYVLEHFEPRTVVRGFEELLDRAHAQTFRAGVAKHRVALSGLNLFCAEVAGLTRSHAPDWEPCLLQTRSRLEVLSSAFALLKSDVWYSIGEAKEDKVLSWLCRLTGKPHVMHWVGSDILHLKDPAIRLPLLGPRFSHLAEVEWTQDELRAFGINAALAPLPPRFEAAAAEPLPDCFTVLFYLPRSRADWYGAQIAERLMSAFKGEAVRYIIAGGGAVEAPPGVATDDIGWREDLRAVYRQSSVLVRFTPRDGLSLMVLEALSSARHVVWTHTFPYVIRAAAYEELEEAIRGLLQRHKEGVLRENVEGRTFVMEHYAPAHCIARIAQAWEAAARPAAQLQQARRDASST